MAKPDLPSRDMLDQLLSYSPDTGALLWKERPASMFEGKKRPPDQLARIWNTRYAGRPAFQYFKFGYQRGSLFGQGYAAHRVIWCLMTGRWPVGEIDHINGIRDDNRWLNLREVTPTENCRNASVRSDNTSGVPGVSRYARTGRWWAYIVIARKTIHLGLFERLEDAIAARKEAETKYGFHPNHGRAASYQP